MTPRLFAISFLPALLLAGAPAKIEVSPDARSALDSISPDSLRGSLSFLASDAMLGRNTPSHELDIAAEFIASQFRRTGLRPAGDDGYFQTSNWVQVEQPMDGFELKFEASDRVLPVSPDQVQARAESKLDLSHVPVVRVDLEHSGSLKPEEVQGKAIVLLVPSFRDLPADQRPKVAAAQARFRDALKTLLPAVVIQLEASRPRGGLAPRLREADAAPSPVSTIVVRDSELFKVCSELKAGAALTITLKVPAQKESPVKLRNVIGVLPGSDPALKDTYVLVTAHYDHLGAQSSGEGDRIFNGANDDGSGTVSVIEIASALAGMKTRPRRSIVFMTFFGEEKGLIGSRYYGRHPVFPTAKTVADVNLEHLGRTDSTEGPQVRNASFTGFDYSEVPAIFATAGDETGIKVYKHDVNSDPYFARSDNQALADVGVPAHTVAVAFNYSDYHGAGDEWQKIDYENMARVDRMVALGLLMIANNPEAPKWNGANPNAAKYLKAWQESHGRNP